MQTLSNTTFFFDRTCNTAGNIWDFHSGAPSWIQFTVKAGTYTSRINLRVPDLQMGLNELISFRTKCWMAGENGTWTIERPCDIALINEIFNSFASTKNCLMSLSIVFCDCFQVCAIQGRSPIGSFVVRGFVFSHLFPFLHNTTLTPYALNFSEGT